MANFVRVSCVSQTLGVSASSGKVDLGMLEEVALQVAADRPDFICFHELCGCNFGDLNRAVKEQAYELPGPVTKEIGRIAQSAGANLIVPLLEKWKGNVYNSTPLVTSAGEYVGTYRKNFPTIGEMEEGITPGTEVPVFECGGVRVGMAVCFDLNFPEVAEQLAAKKARLVFWPSMYWGGDLLSHWALRYGFYMGAAYAAESAIVDMGGRFLARRGYGTSQVQGKRLPPWVTVEINTDREVFHLDQNQNKFPELLRKFGPDIAIEVYQPEAFFTLASLSPDFTVEDIIRDYKLETLRDYLARSKAFREKRMKAEG